MEVSIEVLVVGGVNLGGIALAFGSLRARVRGLEERTAKLDGKIEKMDETLHNGLSEHVAQIEERTRGMVVVPHAAMPGMLLSLLNSNPPFRIAKRLLRASASAPSPTGRKRKKKKKSIER